MCHVRGKFLLWDQMEREKGIEPSLPAWKAGVLPLNYSRMVSSTGFFLLTTDDLELKNGQRRIRTPEGKSQQIYSLSSLTT